MCDAIVYPNEENAVYFKFFLDCNFMCISVKALQVIYEMNIFNTRNSRILGSRRGWEINKIYNANTKPLFCLLFFSPIIYPCHYLCETNITKKR